MGFVLGISDDKSVYNGSGQIVHYILGRFVSDIVEGDCCFFCGAKRDSREFNEEHVIPRWLLRKHDLHDKQVVMPNGTSIRYGSYKIPCCADCNHFLGKTFETPISNLFDRGFQAVSDSLFEPETRWRLFRWLNLLYFKAHYRDRLFPEVPDERNRESRTVFEARYDPAWFHHLHAVIRSGTNGVRLDNSVLGSIWVLPAVPGPDPFSGFDYSTFSNSQTILIRSGETAIVSALSDACAVLSLTNGYLVDRMYKAAPFLPLQLREWLARVAYLRSSLVEGPDFYSDFGRDPPLIAANHPQKVMTTEHNDRVLGGFIYSSAKELLEGQPPETLTHIKEGRWTWLPE